MANWTTPRDWVQELVDETDLNTHVRDNLKAASPIGELKLLVAPATATATLLHGAWLECNGVAVSRTTYADLYTYLNTIRVTRGTTTTTLSGTINSSQTTLVVASYPATWPGGASSLYVTPTAADPFEIIINSEKMLVTGLSGTTLTVARDAEGTIAATHSDTATISLSPDLPFGSGDGETTFHIPDLHGRVPYSATRSGGHADAVAIGPGDMAALSDRRPRHRHTAAGFLGNNSVGGAYPNQGSGSDSSTPSTIPVTVGPQANSPLDAPGHLVVGVWAIKAIV